MNVRSISDLEGVVYLSHYVRFVIPPLNGEGFDLEKELLNFLTKVIGDKRSTEELKSHREQQVKSVKSYFGIEEE